MDRKEYKYLVPLELLDSLRERFLMCMAYDPYSLRQKDNKYYVRSIYFDTSDLLFYHEKLSGIKIRKKLRIRTYNERETSGNYAFLEIKRKYDDSISKERVKIDLSQAANLLNGFEYQSQEYYSSKEKRALENFIYNLKYLNLFPNILVTYAREAMVGKDDPSFRVTFDMDVCSCPCSGVEDIFRCEDMNYLYTRHFILELKFYERMPYFARQIIQDCELRQQAISKYCNCLDLWETIDLKFG